MSHKNPINDILLSFVSNKTDNKIECASEISPDSCQDKILYTPTHINNLVGYVILRDRWIDFEFDFIDTIIGFRPDMYVPCGWCTPCEEGISLLWDFEGKDYTIAPGMINIVHKCCCFPDDYCDPGYALLYNFQHSTE